MLTTFTRINGTAVSVNPTFVRSVAPHPTTDGQSVSKFGAEDRMAVLGDHVAVRDQLNAAMR